MFTIFMIIVGFPIMIIYAILSMLFGAINSSAVKKVSTADNGLKIYSEIKKDAEYNKEKEEIEEIKRSILTLLGNNTNCLFTSLEIKELLKVDNKYPLYEILRILLKEEKIKTTVVGLKSYYYC